MPAKMPLMPLKKVVKKTLMPKKEVPDGISLGMEEDDTTGIMSPTKPKAGAKQDPRWEEE